MDKKFTIIILCIIAILGFVLRMYKADQSLWLDEASQAVMSSASVKDIWLNRQGDFHPPLFYLVAHYWQSISRSDAWLRLLPISIGSVNIFAIYLLCKTFLKEKHIIIRNKKVEASLVASFLLAIFPFHVYYSQEYRSYSLLCLFATISWIFFSKLDSKKFSVVAGLGITNTLIMYTHYSGIFIILTQIVYGYIFYKKSLLQYFITLFASIILYIPWIPQLIAQFNTGINIETYLPGWGKVLSLPTFSSLPIVLFKLVAGRINFEPKVFYFFYVGVVLMYVFIAIVISPLRQKLSIAIFAPIVFMIAISLFFPQTQPFRLIYILPFIILGIVSSSLHFPKTLLSIAIYICLFGNVLYFTRPRLQREQWRQAIAEFSEQSAVVVKFPGPFAPLTWYDPSRIIVPGLSKMPAQTDDVKKQLTDNRLLTSHIYLLQYLTGLSDPNLVIEKELKEMGYEQNSVKDYQGVGFVYQLSRK